MSERRVLVVGEGIAGQALALALVERDVPVLLIARDPAPATESVASREGLDAALGADDSPETHAQDVLELAAGTAREVEVAALTRAAPEIAARLQQLAVPFERDREHQLLLSKLAGSSRARTLHASSLTARHVSRRLAARLRAIDGERLVRLIGREVIRWIQDDTGAVVGAVTRDTTTGELGAAQGHAICLATGGYPGLLSGETAGLRALGGALGLALGSGAAARNLAARSSGVGYHSAGFVRPLPERLVAMGSLSDDGTLLDLTACDRSRARAEAGVAISAFMASTGKDPLSEPIAVVPAVVRTLGGLTVETDPDPDSPKNFTTSLPGLWAIGGAAAFGRGSASSSGARLLEALFGAEHAARALASHVRNSEARAIDPALVRDAVDRERARIDALLETFAGCEDGASPFELADELARAVESGSSEALDRVADGLASARCPDESPVGNVALSLLLELEPALSLGRAIAREAA